MRLTLKYRFVSMLLIINFLIWACASIVIVELDGLDLRHKIYITRNVTAPFTRA